MRFALPIMALPLASAAGTFPEEERSLSGVWNPDELRVFLDGGMEAQQKTQHFAGAVVVVVRGGLANCAGSSSL